MKSRLAQVALAALVLIVFCCAQAAFGARASRIELKNGQVYEDVDFSVDDVYKVLTIKRGDWKLSFSLPDIARIIDENGQDVSADYLRDYYEPPEESQESDWLPEKEMQRKGYRMRPFDFGIRAGANFSFPTGDYYEGTKSGVGYGFDAIIPVTRNIAIRGTISRSGMQDDLKSYLAYDVSVLDDNLSLNVWRYALSAQYYSWPGWRTGGSAMYYLYGGVGAISHKFSGTMTVQNRSTGEIGVIYPTGDAQTEFMFTYGGGLVAMLARQVGLEIGATVDWVFAGGQDDQVYYGPGGNAFVLDLKAGLVGLF